MPPDLPLNPADSPDEWVRYARSDLALAEAVPPEAVLLETLCFHTQQAAEKALKAVIVWEKTQVRKTHDLSVLLDMIAVHVPEAVASCVWLNVYAVSTRYPAVLEEVDHEMWHRATAQARVVVEWASGVIA